MQRPPFTRITILTASIIVLALFLVSPVAALSVEIGDWTGPALPGEAVTAPVTVTYGCGELLPLADVELEAVIQDGAEGTLGFDGESFTPATPITDCTPGEEDPAHNFTISYTAPMTLLAGSTESITVRASYNVSDDADALNDAAEDTINAVVGPFMDVSFSATNDTFTVIGGDTVTVEIEMTADSNAEVMAMDARLAVPDGWEAPSITPPRTVPDEELQPVTVSFSFDIQVPEEVDGEHVLVFSSWVHTVTDPSLESDPMEVPLTFQVTPLSVHQAEQEESPAPAAVVVLVALLAAIVATRRRA